LNAELDLDVADQAPAQIACDDERLVTTIVNARTPDEYLTATWSCSVLIAVIIFQDGSWVRTNLSCEPLYYGMVSLIFFIWYPKNVLYRVIAADALLLFWQLPC
jgi:hypothetical protein